MIVSRLSQGGLKMIPKEGFLRLSELLKIIPVGKTTWWQGVKSKRYPQPVKLGPRITVWRKSDIQRFLENPEQWQQ